MYIFYIPVNQERKRKKNCQNVHAHSGSINNRSPQTRKEQREDRAISSNQVAPRASSHKRESSTPVHMLHYVYVCRESSAAQARGNFAKRKETTAHDAVQVTPKVFPIG